MPVLGLLLTEREGQRSGASWPEPLREALAAFGWVDGRTIRITSRFAEGEFQRLPPLAAELVALRPDVLLTHSGPGAHAAAAATRTIPIVVGAASEESLVDLTGELARPKGNVTGLTIASIEQHAKCVELLTQIHPGARRIGVLVNPSATLVDRMAESLTALLGSSGLSFHRILGTALEVEPLRASFEAARIDALLVTATPLFNRPECDRAINAAAKSIRVPHCGTFEAGTRAGSLFSLGADYQRLIQRSAFYVDRILRGATPADLPVERPTVFRFVLNLSSAQALGLTVPPALLARADEIID